MGSLKKMRRLQWRVTAAESVLPTRMRRSPRLAQSPCHQNRANWSSDLSPTFAKSGTGLATIAKLTAAERQQLKDTLYRTSRTLQKLPQRVTQEVVRRLASRNEMVANAASKDEA